MKDNYLTVLMTVYNNSRFLQSSIESICNQKDIPFEFFILNDGSDEYIEKIIDKFSDNRIRYFKFKRIGLIAALNEGVAKCKSEFLAIIDSDDVSPPERLARQLSYLEQNPQIGLVGTSIKYFVKNVEERIWSVRMPADHAKIVKGLRRGKFLLHHSTIMARTSLIKKVGAYSSESYPVPDLDLILRVSSVSELANLSDIYSFIRLHQDNFTIRHLKSIVEKRYYILNRKKPEKIRTFKHYKTIIHYRSGIINLLEQKYMISFYHFLLTFLLSPFQSLIYLIKKMRIST